ncbi:hypothetical protein EDD17DRAFT_891274 [Pisolithus thermaeus]|nr:hypothetical protein EV401DRAFT_1449616 [Pisolithus croceorrhizus]KAI6159486.1 hypothetical protein EDD17DRAFT_891274 [Pisolithus thermaeus]
MAATTEPTGILVPEIDALTAVLKNALLKTGQIYAFHADAQRLGLRKYAPHPPPDLVASLGHELQKYDQLCDAIEIRVLHAISILKRDLAREECRAKQAEITAMAAQVPPSDAGSVTADTTMQPPPAPIHGSAQGSIPSRRQSAISLSSLHRQPFPLKLDLSSSRMSAEEAALYSKGLLASPVSLAPKSARPTGTSDIDLIAAFASATAANAPQHVDIDLTMDDSPPAMMSRINVPLGSSADKPIELDLDGIEMDMPSMTDLFGDGPESSSGSGQVAMDGLFTPTATEAGAPHDGVQSKDTKSSNAAGMEILDALTVESSNHGPNLFGTIQRGSGDQMNDGSQQTVHGGDSPGSLLASFTNQPQHASGAEHMQTDFDLSTIDFSSLDPAIFGDQSMDMDTLLNIHHPGASSDGQRSNP